MKRKRILSQTTLASIALFVFVCVPQCMANKTEITHETPFFLAGAWARLSSDGTYCVLIVLHSQPHLSIAGNARLEVKGILDIEISRSSSSIDELMTAAMWTTGDASALAQNARALKIIDAPGSSYYYFEMSAEMIRKSKLTFNGVGLYAMSHNSYWFDLAKILSFPTTSPPGEFFVGP